jgi:hypothetical protein
MPASIIVPVKGWRPSPVAGLNAEQLAWASTRCILDAQTTTGKALRARRSSRRRSYRERAQQQMALGFLTAKLAEYLAGRSKRRGVTVLGSDLSVKDVRRAWQDAIAAMQSTSG